MPQQHTRNNTANPHDKRSRKVRPGRRNRILCTVFLLVSPLFAAFANAAAPVTGEGGWLYDGDWLRGYIGLRFGVAFPSNREFGSGFSFNEGGAQQSPNAQVGMDLSRYLSLELDLSYYETDYDAAGAGTVGEITIYSLIPQIRVRYPMYSDRFVPYLVGGVGIGFTETSDPTPITAKPGVPILSGKESSVAGSVGVGFDYYLAQNLALNLEAKQLFFRPSLSVKYLSTGQTGENVDLNLDATILSLGLRLYFPESAAAGTFPGVSWNALDPDGITGYIGLGFGFWHMTNSDFTAGLEAQAGGDQQQLSALKVGADLNRWLGLELAVDYYETEVNDVSTNLKINELSVWSFVAQARARYPLYDYRLVPYALAGLGFGFIEFNDTTEYGNAPGAPRLGGPNYAPAATLGVGVDWFVASNIALEAETKYLFLRPDVEIDGRAQGANLDTLLLALGLRVFFP